MDGLNIFGTTRDIEEVISYLMLEFKTDDLGKPNYLVLRLDHSLDVILVHQSVYSRNVLESFGFDKTYNSKTLMIQRSLHQDKDPIQA